MKFYEKCAEILGVHYTGESFKWYKRTRWNNRVPGEGRFEGFGLIRKFGDNIQVALRYPVLHHKIYKSEKEVLDFLSSLNYIRGID